MKSYIPRQVKQTRERIEVKLEHDMIRHLECYCQYLDSDRDYVVAKLLEIAFKKDKGFEQWLKKVEPHPGETPANHAEPQAASGGKE